LASTASLVTRAAEIALVASGWAICAGMPASASRSANQPPAVGGLDHDLDRLGLQLPQDPEELGWALPIRRDNSTAPAGSRATTGERLRCRSTPTKHHDRASVLSLAQRRTLCHARSTGAEARSFMASTGPRAVAVVSDQVAVDDIGEVPLQASAGSSGVLAWARGVLAWASLGW